MVMVRHKFIGYGGITLIEMFKHICESTIIQLIAVIKIAFKHKGYEKS